MRKSIFKKGMGTVTLILFAAVIFSSHTSFSQKNSAVKPFIGKTLTEEKVQSILKAHYRGKAVKGFSLGRLHGTIQERHKLLAFYDVCYSLPPSHQKQVHGNIGTFYRLDNGKWVLHEIEPLMDPIFIVE